MNNIEKTRIFFPVYDDWIGSPWVEWDEVKNKYYIVIQSNGSEDRHEISKEFYVACMREFN